MANILGYTKVNTTKIYYGNGAKNEVLKLGKKYNFKFFYRIDNKTLKYCSAGFNNIKNFLDIIKPIGNDYYIYEYLNSNNMCKPYIDYEFYQDNEPTKEFIKEKLDKFKNDMISVFKQKYKKDIHDDDIIILDSSGKRNDKYKLSYHFIINSNYVFQSNKLVVDYAKELNSTHPDVDLSVYSTDRMMRTILSAKDFNDKRTLRLLDKKYNHVNVDIKDLKKYLITNVPSEYEVINIKLADKKKIIKNTITCEQNKKTVDLIDKKSLFVNEASAVLKKIQHIITTRYHEDSYYTGETFADDKTGYTFYKFNYCNHDKFCFTGNHHDHLGFYCYADGLNNVIVKCFSDKCKDSKYIVGNLCDSDEQINYININKKFLPDSDTVMEKLKNLHDTLKSLVIKSPMGTGKTHVICKYIDLYAPKRILLISTRQSYANNVFSRLEKYGFVNYLYNKDSFHTSDRLIVQLESMDNLLKNDVLKPFDFIVLDEIESIMFHFNSDTIIEKSHETFNLLHTLCKSKKSKVMVLDADYDDRGHQFVKSLSENVPFELIKNEYKNPERKLILTNKYDYFMNDIMKSINKKEKICIVGMSASKLTSIAELLEKNKISHILHTRDTDDKIKAKLVDVNTLWSIYQVVLFSPTLTVGVSHDIKYFDRIYSIIIGNCCSSRTFLQMCGRVRDPKCLDILTYYEKSVSTRTDRIVYNYDDLFEYYKYVAVENFMKKKYKEDENGNISHENKIGLYEKIMIMNDIENMNKCCGYFMTSLNQLCNKCNYKLVFKDVDLAKDNVKLELNTKAYTKKIIDSPNINGEEYYAISQKINKNEATEAEKFSFQKYKIKKFWNKDNIDQEFLDKYFRKEDYLSRLKYILGKVNKSHVTEIDIQKTDVVKDIIEVLGFNLRDLTKIIKGKDFYENASKLLTDSMFSKNYENVRILFDKPKSILKPNLKGTYLTSMLNSYLSEFGLCIMSTNVIKWDNKLKKHVRASDFVLRINNDYIMFCNP